MLPLAMHKVSLSVLSTNIKTLEIFPLEFVWSGPTTKFEFDFSFHKHMYELLKYSLEIRNVVWNIYDQDYQSLLDFANRQTNMFSSSDTEEDRKCNLLERKFPKIVYCYSLSFLWKEFGALWNTLFSI